jgi:hypothetical protein
MSDFIDRDFDEFMKNSGPGRVLVSQQLLRYRQGGDARSWGEPGSASYVPRGAFLQAGSVSWSGEAATHGSLTFAFKNAFIETPLVLVTVVNTTPLFKGVWFQAASDGPGMEIWWWSGDALTEVWFHWLAVGPGAV